MGLELVSPWIKSKVNFRVPGFEPQQVHQYMGVSFKGRTTHFDCVDVCSSQATPARLDAAYGFTEVTGQIGLQHTRLREITNPH